jgi:hypothetical protein
MYRAFQKELYNGIPNVVWRVLRKRLHLKACKLSIVQHSATGGCNVLAVTFFGREVLRKTPGPYRDLHELPSYRIIIFGIEWGRINCGTLVRCKRDKAIKNYF